MQIECRAGGRSHWGMLGAVPLVMFLAAGLQGQEWNDPPTMALVHRAIAARQQAAPDSTLRSYRTTAHGFVFFLGQAGRNLESPPRLIKADELLVDVFWQAPGINRQVIRGWRDGRWLPTDISYHRDHLGIVTNNFGDRIRIGEGDEVRDVVHPLAPDGPAAYDYRLADSLQVATRDTIRRLHEVLVRPRDPSQPRVIGTLSLDAGSGDLVRFRFSFTPSAYLDRSLEDLSVSLENARIEGRWWLPWRQDIEIRRRLTWLDVPARTIIRGRWEIGEYTLNTELPRAVRFGPGIGGLRRPADSSFAGAPPLAEAVANVARPVEAQDLDALRTEVTAVAAGRVLNGLGRTRLGLASISDLIRVNRVQGLALGAGLSLVLHPGVALRPRAAFGTSDHRITGGVTLEWTRAASRWVLTAGRQIADIGDAPIVSGVMNSLLAQEGGRDLGDYVRLDHAGATVTRRLGTVVTLDFGVGVEHTRSVSVAASPATGRYRANPALGVGTLGTGRVAATLARTGLDRDRIRRFRVRIEGGQGAGDYARLTSSLQMRGAAGPGILDLRLEGGIATLRLPGYRSQALGGWGTLPGEGFRSIGGRRVAWGWLEYRVEAPAPEIPLGPFFSTGPRLVVAPFLAAGVAGGRVPGVPWRATADLRPVAGVALEFFHRLIRVETGVSLRTGRVGLAVDVDREWWEIL